MQKLFRKLNETTRWFGQARSGAVSPVVALASLPLLAFGVAAAQFAGGDRQDRGSWVAFHVQEDATVVRYEGGTAVGLPLGFDLATEQGRDAFLAACSRIKRGGVEIAVLSTAAADEALQDYGRLCASHSQAHFSVQTDEEAIRAFEAIFGASRVPVLTAGLAD